MVLGMSMFAGNGTSKQWLTHVKTAWGGRSGSDLKIAKGSNGPMAGLILWPGLNLVESSFVSTKLHRVVVRILYLVGNFLSISLFLKATLHPSNREAPEALINCWSIHPIFSKVTWISSLVTNCSGHYQQVLMILVEKCGHFLFL